MKKFLLSMILALLGVTQVVAQEYEYVPLVREGVKWVCFYKRESVGRLYVNEESFQMGRNYFTLELKGDVEINGKQYKALHKYSGDAIDPQNDTVLICLREEDKVVYGIVPDGKTYPDFFIGYNLQLDIKDEIKSGTEFVLYDFNDPEEWVGWMFRRNSKQISSMGYDMVDIGGKPRMRHTFFMKFDSNNFYLIEGIGADGYCPCYLVGFLNFACTYDPLYYLSHVVENGEVIYRGINYEYIAPIDGRLPIVREGMKWVNERVIINKGDTTRYYYTYELRGDDKSDAYHLDNEFKYCHYYTGEKLDPDNDSIICSMFEFPGYYATYCDKNPAMDKMEEEGRNMLLRKCREEVGIEQLYFINHYNTRYIFYEYYSWQPKQLPFCITKDNFVEVEPVEIEGRKCCRYAYLGEDGQPLAYVVEGIGFDSREMGDLLTPFTRKPDPDADYQEYCGLSHVIKDGKIIYKGMRYREEAAEAALVGDVNGDSLVNIEDVTALIDTILRPSDRYTMSCDVDNDGSVGISDLTVLIDMLLSSGSAAQ